MICRYGWPPGQEQDAQQGQQEGSPKSLKSDMTSWNSSTNNGYSGLVENGQKLPNYNQITIIHQPELSNFSN
jgi:hypothetical protein